MEMISITPVAIKSNKYETTRKTIYSIMALKLVTMFKKFPVI